MSLYVKKIKLEKYKYNTKILNKYINLIDNKDILNTLNITNIKEIIPSFNNGATTTFLMFCVYLTIQWWCTWYPGAEPGGGGYVAQRMFSTKNDKDAMKASLLLLAKKNGYLLQV